MVGLDPGLGRVTNRIVLTHFTGRTTHHTNGSLTPRISSNNAPQPDGALNNADRNKVLHCRHLYADLSDPIVLLTVVVNTSGQLYDDFLEPSFVILECSVSGELTEESDTAFLQLKEFSLRNPTSSTTATRRSPHRSNRKLVISSRRLQLHVSI
jgi:hypothetical protein